MAHTVFVDWGTTNFRAYLVAPSGTVVACKGSAEGVKSATGRHAEILESHVRDWIQNHDIDAIACAGTIGSELGWRDVPMIDAPAGLEHVARSLQPLTVPGLPPIWIIPGVCQRDNPERPGMMRGEEVILFGCLARSGLDSGLFCCPGTHSKWVTVEDGMICDIQTVMTGECFDLFRTGSVLARSLSGWSGDIDPAWFAKGVGTAMDVANPLQSAFFVRALHVQGRLPTPDARASYLSGLLIGAEVRGMAPGTGRVTIVAPAKLVSLYAQACGVVGFACDTVDDEACFVAGARAVLRMHGQSMLGPSNHRLQHTPRSSS
ncbi:2-dehydro-3-deoxygalactonokinase [uncultured Alsobacter sp.]|uniref:2-dehydro-3-deoxygalactonokinase n=1 Tax=uncultured Alsobacter sp. TaxID=1748258 RepID=UPI0025CE8FA2|nr:2-dehydro-3-deoxygalactonokinase [uncultured Alsobacter sp.]